MVDDDVGGGDAGAVDLDVERCGTLRSLAGAACAARLTNSLAANKLDHKHPSNSFCLLNYRIEAEKALLFKRSEVQIWSFVVWAQLSLTL